uniref:Ulp1 protease family, C-terminal catalytic domain containing protein n=1 Tax=Solanum tuberosum TaxID=4113 RepID=M1BCZ8_SOLTU
MEQGKSLSVGVSQINSINDNRTYDSDDEMWAENRSKHLHDPLVMKDKSVVKPKNKDEVEALDLPDIQDAHTPGPSTTAVDAKKVQTKDSSGFEDFSTSPHGHLFRRSSRVSGTSSPPPPKKRKKIDTSKTKLSEPKSSDQLRPAINQSFSMLDEAPAPAANVSFVHVSSQGQKDKSVYPDIEELKQHMKDYVSNDINFFQVYV